MDWFNELPTIVRWAIYLFAGSVIFAVFMQVIVLIVGLFLTLFKKY